MGPDAIILVFWRLSFKPTFSLSSLTFIKRLFSYSSLSAIRVVSSAYLKLLIFLPAILIPTCASSSPASLMMHSAYKLNKQGDNIQSWRTPFPIWNQPVVPSPVLTVASWPADRFLRRQVRQSSTKQKLQLSWKQKGNQSFNWYKILQKKNASLKSMDSPQRQCFPYEIKRKITSSSTVSYMTPSEIHKPNIIIDI